jgi:hypothetical protein
MLGVVQELQLQVTTSPRRVEARQANRGYADRESSDNI